MLCRHRQSNFFYLSYTFLYDFKKLCQLLISLCVFFSRNIGNLNVTATKKSDILNRNINLSTLQISYLSLLIVTMLKQFASWWMWHYAHLPARVYHVLPVPHLMRQTAYTLHVYMWRRELNWLRCIFENVVRVTTKVIYKFLLLTDAIKS